MTLERERQSKDQFFKSHPQSPLTPEQKAKFDSLDYYPPNPALDLTLEAEEFTTKENLEIQTSTGDVRTYQRWGKIHFTVNGESAELTLLFSPDHGSFFLPFKDLTNGAETYGAGRYLDAEWLDDDRFHINFNEAYSPYCAYNANWSCPLTPFENHLKVRIEAGEKKPDAVWAEAH